MLSYRDIEKIVTRVLVKADRDIGCRNSVKIYFYFFPPRPEEEVSKYKRLPLNRVFKSERFLL